MGQKKTRLSGLLIKGDENMNETDMMTRQQYAKQNTISKLTFILIMGAMLIFSGLIILVVFANIPTSKPTLVETVIKVLALALAEITFIKNLAEAVMKRKYQHKGMFLWKKLLVIALYSLTAMGLITWLILPATKSTTGFWGFVGSYGNLVKLLIVLFIQFVPTYLVMTASKKCLVVFAD